jgi:hypothetical protein
MILCLLLLSPKTAIAQKDAQVGWAHHLSDVVVRYLDLRWVVTQEKPLIILCHPLDEELDKAEIQRIMAATIRVVTEISAGSKCGPGNPAVSASDEVSVIQIKELLTDVADTSRGLLRSVTDTRRGYYVGETVRYHRSSGAVFELIFGGFEEYYPP